MATARKWIPCRRLVFCICGAFPHMGSLIGDVSVGCAMEVLVVLVREEHLEGVDPTSGLNQSDLVSEIARLIPQVRQLAENEVYHHQSPQCRPLLPQWPSNLPVVRPVLLPLSS